MRAAVQDIEHGRGKNAGVDAAKIAIKRNFQRLRDGARSSHRNGENGVCAQLAFVRRAIEGDHRLVNQPLVACVHAFEFGRNHGFNVGHGLQNTFAEEVAFIAVAEFHSLMLAGGSAGRNNCAAHGAALENHICFHGGIAARVKNFARANSNDFSHICPHNAVQQPVVEFGTAIHGKDFTGGALNRFQKPLHGQEFPPRPVSKNSIVDLSVRVRSPGSGEVARIRGGFTVLEMPEKCEDVSLRILTNDDPAGGVACVTPPWPAIAAIKFVTGA